MNILEKNAFSHKKNPDNNLLVLTQIQHSDILITSLKRDSGS